MSPAHPITALFLDIGGVLLTDGWGLDYRTLAARTFDLDPVELESRHHQAFDTYETGKLSLDEYLARVVFHRQRAFTPVQFREFMFAQSRPHPEMLDLVRRLKAKYALKLIVVSNEGRELNAHRIQAFGLDRLADAFISSCYVHLRKPDPDIFRLALDVTQTPAGQIIYIENTPMFVTIAEGLGIRSILHTSYQATRAELAQAGLVEDQP
jgi:putative hydrolase of the HAD superfamily